ncbi:unnamed protein product [Caretta caretta]
MLTSSKSEPTPPDWSSSPYSKQKDYRNGSGLPNQLPADCPQDLSIRGGGEDGEHPAAIAPFQCITV